MFDIGFAELLVLAVIAMVVVGPERLPSLLRTVGKTVGQARRFMTGIQNQIEQEVKLDELNKKIMAESKQLDISADLQLNHQNEDAEAPQQNPEINEEHSIHNPDEPSPQNEAKTNDSDRS